MSTQINKNLLRELIKLSLRYGESAGFGSKLTEKTIQKMLYELKRNLPETNPIKEQLPYYWFKAGVYSEYIAKELDVMTVEGILKKEQRDNYALFELDQSYTNKRFVEHDQHLIEARGLLQAIMSNLQPFSIYNEIKSQYEDDAPSLFYPRFKLQFLPNIEIYCKAVKFPERRPSNFHPETQRDCMLKLLSVCTSSLPYDSVFSKFKKTYFDYENSFSRLLRWNYRKNKEKYVELLEEALKLSWEVWNTFAYGGRIIRHDPIYSSRVEEWKEMLDDKVNDLSIKVDEFYKKVLEETNDKREKEKYLSLPDFVELIITAKKNEEISFINFPSQPKMEAFPKEIFEKIEKIPEFSAFMREGHLDWPIINELTNEELEEIIKRSVSSGPIYAAFSKKKEMPATEIYRIDPNSLSSEEPIEILS